LFLLERAAACQQAGIGKSRIWLDPGFGFGKTLAHNCRLFAHIPQFVATGYPILVGVSRKSMIGQLLNVEVSDRVIGSVTAAVLAAQKGAKILRVHDVKETVQALKILKAMTDAE
jgi:dihydropteroate synthase